DEDGPRDGYHAVRQERPIDGLTRARWRGLHFVFDRHADGRGRDHTVDLYTRAPLLIDRRSANLGQTVISELAEIRQGNHGHATRIGRRTNDIARQARVDGRLEAAGCPAAGRRWSVGRRRS